MSPTRPARPACPVNPSSTASTASPFTNQRHFLNPPGKPAGLRCQACDLGSFPPSSWAFFRRPFFAIRCSRSVLNECTICCFRRIKSQVTEPISKSHNAQDIQTYWLVHGSLLVLHWLPNSSAKEFLSRIVQKDGFLVPQENLMVMPRSFHIGVVADNQQTFNRHRE